MVRQNGSLFANTITNDLVIYHQNIENQIVIGTGANATNATNTSNTTNAHSALTITSSNVIAPNLNSTNLSLDGYPMQSPQNPNYAYGIFTTATATTSNILQPLTGALTVARNGIDLDSDNFTLVMPSGLYACIMTYDLTTITTITTNTTITISAIADGSTTFDYGQCVTNDLNPTNPNIISQTTAKGSISFTLFVQNNMQIQMQMQINTPESIELPPQTLSMRRIG